ncbi:CDP-alcohol phosphatidyltransferase family protein [Actinoplanes sp. NEAU-A12]|uniref:CDP-alcohol phosphatidyltransferase family protein n=1 Tax=Actinoplanes sandaracinus TaxID=3045177 RepID=A0ABT6WE09_9ACTN|nr:CDP-alcohol phosphatidyltransferase family protein [Actinoplanes sandaracinus]MDI6097957.1 CDP-alcohol phosphatidyltransferase family protein [Actinoplanes sandaracinus]
MTWDEYATAWSGLHGGFDPRRASPLVRGWVRGAYEIGSWLGRKGVAPVAVTLAGLLLCLAVPLAAPAGVPGLAGGAVLVLLAAAADGLDGAVAVITGRVTRGGFVYDSVADRIGEAAWLAAFWLAGVPGWLVVIAGAASWLHEYLRARAAVAGMPDIGTVTVGERPARVAVTVTGLILAPLAAFVSPGWTVPVLTVAVAIWLILQVIGLIQLAAAVRAALR